MDPTAALREQFVRLLGGTHVDEPGGLLGVEQEFTVRTGTARPADFREVFPTLPVDGVALDPSDPNAYRCRSGVVVTVDGREAEVATPPVSVQPGFASETEAWARAARNELVALLPATYSLSGYSTHLSVSIDDVRNPRVGALFARTFAPGLMLLVDRATSPGLIVRPRPGRTELCGEFVDGPLLRAAAVYAVGSVLACRDAMVGARSLAALPPQLEATLRPASARAGWYVDRTAFGPDLLTTGRAARLRRCDGRRTRAQDHLELSWEVARDALGARVDRGDLETLDELVSGARMLPCETPAADDGGTAGPIPAPSALGEVGRTRTRPAFSVLAVASTWKLTVFRVRSRLRERDAYAAIPRAHLARFFEQLELGALDEVVTNYLAVDAGDRPVATTGSEPSIGDTRPSNSAITDDERDAQLTGAVPASKARSDKSRRLVLDTPTPTTERRGGLPPIAKWAVGITAGAIVVGGIAVALLSGGSGEEKQATTPTTPSGSTSTFVCGSQTAGAQIDIDAIVRTCRYSRGQLSGTGDPYALDTASFENATINVTGPSPEPVFGTPCPVHTATPEELNAAKDPLTGFVGLSFIGFGAAGLPPGTLLEVTLRAPDGQIRTGRGIADARGYAEARVPINVPQTHTIVSARYFPNGNPAGPSVPIAPTAITANGEVDASFPGFRCDEDATIAKVPPVAPGSAATAKLAQDTISDSASLFAPLEAFSLPGMSLSFAGPWTVDGEGRVFGIHDGVRFDLVAVANAGGDRPGDAPASVYYHGGATIGPSGAGAGAAWQQAFPCGPGQLSLTICPRGATDLADGTYAAVAAVFDQPIPLSPRTNTSYTFTVGDQHYEASYDVRQRARGVDAWSLAGPDPGARLLLRNNVALLVVPRAAVGNGTYRITTAVGQKHDTQPPADEPAGQLRTTIAVAAVPGSQPAETAEQFVSTLAHALTTGDTAFIRTRLHPVVVERYGGAACDAFAAGQHPALELVAQSVSPPGPYAWATDGLSRDVPNTNEVTVTETQSGQTTTGVVHVALVDGTWRWFTDCGDPLPGAP